MPSDLDPPRAPPSIWASTPRMTNAPTMGELLVGGGSEQLTDGTPFVAPFAIGTEDSIKNLYEGKSKCECCTNWVDEYPIDVKEALEGTQENQRHALLVRNKIRHSGHEPLQLDSIVIQSPYLKPVIAKIFEGYPGITAGLNNLTFSSPFIPFFHRLERLEDATKHQENEKTLAHVNLLYDAVKSELSQTVQAQKDLLAHGVITFEYLWTLFPPETILYHSAEGQDHIYKLKSAKYTGRSAKTYEITCEYLDWDGWTFCYGTRSFFIRSFDGTKQIVDLETYPVRYHNSPEELKSRLRTRGKRFESFQGCHYKNYDGLVLAREGEFNVCKRNVHGRIMIDAESYRRSNPNAIQLLRPISDVDSTLYDQDWIEPIVDSHENYDYNERTSRQRRCRRRRSRSPPRRDNLRPIMPLLNNNSFREPKEYVSLSEEQLLLCSPLVKGFSLKTKDWAEFFVDNISDIEWNDNAFESLVLPSNHKELILSFVEGQVMNNDAFDDVIEGKGQGIIMLLTGAAGVGKTLTAESVAETMRTPLYSISAGELGVDVGQVDGRLSKILEISTRWNAILLLDEADVFLEARSSDNLERNSLTSIFLRKLEYYRGILFLTTNRLSAFDPAFHSRIHITIHYPNLDASARKTIWRNFLQLGVEAHGKLDKNRSNEGRIISIDGKQIDSLGFEVPFQDPKSGQGLQKRAAGIMDCGIREEELSMLAQCELNGRQIKNVVKTAQLLARRQGVQVGLGHVQTVLEVTQGRE